MYHLFLLSLIFTPALLWLCLRPVWMRGWAWMRVCVWLAALVSLLGGLGLVMRADLWTSGRRLAWRALSIEGASASLGGPKEEAVVAWPSGEFLPRVTLQKPASGVEIMVGNGGGALALEQSLPDGKKQLQFINGTPVPADGGAIGWSGYQIAVREEVRLAWLQPLLRLIGGMPNRLQVVLSNRAGKEMLRFAAPRPGMGRPPLMMTMAEGIEIRSLQLSQENASPEVSDLLALRDWAHGRMLMIPDAGPVRVVGLDDKPATLKAPELAAGKHANLIVFGLGRRREYADVSLDADKGGMRWRFDFHQPFRLGSPLPPHPEQLVITGRSEPGDEAFVLPVGQAGRTLRGKLPMKKGEGGRWLFNLASTHADVVPLALLKGANGMAAEAVEDAREVLLSPTTGVEIAVANDFPAVGSLLLPAVLTLAALGLALVLVAHDETAPDALRSWWAVNGLLLVLWAFMVLRLVLAMRYALDPGRVDAYAVATVTQCWLGMMWAPALLLLCVKLMRFEPGGDVFVLAGIAGVAVLCGVQWNCVAGLWPGFRPVFPWVTHFFGPGLILALAWVARRLGLKGNMAGFWRAVHGSWRIFFGALIFIAVLLWGIFAGIGWILTQLPMFDEPMQEIIGPFVLWWSVAWVWLSVRAVNWEAVEDEENPAQRRRAGVRVLCCALAFGLGPMALVPLAFHDKGLFYAGGPVFLSLALVLALGGKPRWHAYALIAWLAAGFFSLMLLVSLSEQGRTWPRLSRIATTLTGEAKVRIKAWKRGDKLEWDYLFSDALPAGDEGEAQKLASFKVLNSVEHRWESRAITHAAGWLGHGLGSAPVRRSQIPAQTLQVDSVFSFYLVGDYGLLGGLIVLLAGTMPLFLVLRSGREGLDLGHGFALLVTTTMAFEAVFHAMMNYGFLPFTGRNLPLLAAGSQTDLLRWVLLLVLGGMTLMRRHHPQVIEQEEPLLHEVPPAGNSPVRSHVLKHTVLLAGTPVLLVVACGWAVHRDVLHNDEYGRPRHWEKLAEGVRTLFREGYIGLKKDGNNVKLQVNAALMKDPGERLVIAQEIERFNEMPLTEKLLEAEVTKYMPQTAGMVDAPVEYSQMLAAMRASSQISRRRPCLFALTRVDNSSIDESGRRKAPEDEFQVIIHPAFDTGLTFEPKTSSKDLPQVAWKNGVALIGPAWTNGVWRSATQVDSPLPWVGSLSRALEREWLNDGRHAGPAASAKRYGTLTLDPLWHAALQDLAARKGRELHAEMLKGLTPSTKVLPEKQLARRLPPRLAFTLVEMTKGEVLGLGSWPRMSSEPFWTQSKDGAGEWLPPESWLGVQAPKSMRLRYGQEQNFTRFIMGSATKPLFAAVALELHPFLNNRFVTRATEKQQHSVFGIPIKGVPWNTDETDRAWYGFSPYLAKSVNHYHVPLGFLCLAESSGQQIDVANGTPPSSDCSFDVPHPWNSYPAFEPIIGFSAAQPDHMEHLDQTRMAAVLRKFYPIATAGKQLRSTARSFWTGNEKDDQLGIGGPDAAESLGGLSPSSTRFQFETKLSSRGKLENPDMIDTPRKFVTLLLGGGSNSWSNVEFAGAFATTVTGHPLVPHITGAEPQTARQPMTVKADQNTAGAVRIGLQKVLSVEAGGTAATHLGAGKAVLAQLEKAGVKAYAKTGTLAAEKGERNNHRFVISLVQWDNERQGTVKKGLVLSAFGEKAGINRATGWVGEFLAAHTTELQAYFALRASAVK